MTERQVYQLTLSVDELMMLGCFMVLGRNALLGQEADHIAVFNLSQVGPEGVEAFIAKIGQVSKVATQHLREAREEQTG